MTDQMVVEVEVCVSTVQRQRLIAVVFQGLAGFDIDTENPINLVVRSVIFLLLIWYCDDIVNLALQIGGTPYTWILDSSLPGVQFGDFNSVLLIIIGVIANGSVALIALILVVILAWNYLKLLLEAAE